MPPRKGNAGNKRPRLDNTKDVKTDVDQVDVKSLQEQVQSMQEELKTTRAELQAANNSLQKAESKLQGIGGLVTCIVNHTPMTHPVCLKNCGHMIDRSALNSMEIVAIQTARDDGENVDEVTVSCPICREETWGSIKSHSICYPMRDIAQIMYPELSYSNPDLLTVFPNITIPSNKDVTEAEVLAILRPVLSKFDDDTKSANTWAEFVMTRVFLPNILQSMKTSFQSSGFLKPGTVYLDLIGSPDRNARETLAAKLKRIFPSSSLQFESSHDGTYTSITIGNIIYREFVATYDARVSFEKTHSASSSS